MVERNFEGPPLYSPGDRQRRNRLDEEREDEVRAEDAETRLRRQIAQQPDLQQYVTDRGIRNASGVFKQMRKFLTQNPYLLEQLSDSHAVYPDHVTMLIVPHMPLVLAHTQRGVSAMAPVLGCTFHAFGDLDFENTLPGSYEVVSSARSEDALITDIWNMASANPNKILSYRGSGLDPRDYIAMGASGLLSNEVFRMGLSGRGNR